MAETQTYEWRDEAKNPGGVQPKKPGLFDAVNPSPNQTGAQAAQATGAMPQASTDPFAGQAAKPRSFSSLFDTQGRTQNISAAQQTIQDLLSPKAGPSMASQLSRSEFDKQAAETGRQAAEQSALAGRMGTGQISGDQLRIGDRLLGARRDMESTLQANEEQQQLARQQAGLGALTNFESLSQQETMQDKALVQDAMQFTSKLDFDKWALEKNLDENTKNRIWQTAENEKARTSTEKIAFAGLAQQDKALAQDAMQFTNKLDFDRYALEKNLDENTKNRIWQATEAEKERQFKAGEGSLDRELQKYGLDQNLGLETKKLAETIRQFDTQDQFNRWAEQNKLDENQKQRLWQSNENDILYKHQKGMQLTDQEHDVLMSKIDKDIKTDLMNLQSTLNITEIEKQGEINTLLEGVRQKGENDRQKNQINSTEYLAKYQADVQKELQKQGFTNDQALQSAQLAAQAEEKRLDRDQTDKLAAAEMLYKNDVLKQEMGIKKEELDLRKTEIQNQTSQFLKEFGLREMQVQSALSSEKMNNLFGTMAALESMPGFADSPDLQAKYNEMMTNVLVDQGLITKDEARMGKLNANFNSYTRIASWKAWALEQGYTENEINTVLSEKEIDATDPNYLKLNPRDITGTGDAKTVQISTNKQGDPVASIGGKTIDQWTTAEWKDIAKSSTQIQNMVEEGVIKDTSTSNFRRTQDVEKWIGEMGIPQTAYTKEGDNIKFKTPIPVIKDGKVYLAEGFTTYSYNKSSFGIDDERRKSGFYGKDPITGEKAVIFDQDFDI